MKILNQRTDSIYNRPNVHVSYNQKIKPYHQKVAKLVAKYSHDSALVLDIGCGVGHTLAEIQKINPHFVLHAADIDEETLAIVKKRVPQVAQTLKINSVEDLIDGEPVYDVIVMSHVLEHTYRPLDIVLGLIKTLKPNGILVLAVPNAVRVGVILRSIIKHHYVNRGHVYAWDRSHWINFLENIAKVDVIEYSGDIVQFPPLSSKLVRPLEILLTKIFPWFTISNIAVIGNTNS